MTRRAPPGWTYVSIDDHSSESDGNALAIVIDGPAGVGKGTLAKLLARKYGFHYLDSGAVYRALAVLATDSVVDVTDIMALVGLCRRLKLEFPADHDYQAFANGRNIDSVLRSEACSELASKIASVAEVRAELLNIQRSFRQLPGLVADGRDLGTVVFPDAQVKIFLDASSEERARRRYKQLIEKGISANFDHLFDSIRERDQRDRTRSTSPLVAASDARVIDSTDMTIEAVLTQAENYIRECVEIKK